MSLPETSSLQQWLDTVSEEQPMTWRDMPPLDLYMDQVITLMNRQFELVKVQTDRPLTPSMINNYVKDGVMPRPEHKRYRREHLVALAIIYLLKAEFTLPEIRELLDGLTKHYTPEEIYECLLHTQVDRLRDAAEEIDRAKDTDEATRYKLAMQLAIEANAKRIAATKLLESLKDCPKDE